ncbi:multidrug resistance-associated protein 1-like isoform X2 [Dysidea avara]|uniref:multidrug resistance-associated protein 1-like isoform X2 n=1 Tax=Dysidea avara TaxID=196820 RepID=UPI003320665C
MPIERELSSGLCLSDDVFWPHRRPDYIGVNDTWHDEVDLAQCFQDTAVLYSICVIFWVLAALRFVFLTRHPPLSYSWLSITKMVLCCVVMVTSLCDLVKTVMDWLKDSDNVPNYQLISPIVLLISAALMIAVITSEIRQGIPSSGIQFCFWGALVVYASIKLRSLILVSQDQSEVEDVFRFVTFIINFVVFLVQFVLSTVSDKRSKYQLVGEDSNPSPELSSSFLSYLTWWWLNGMIITGWRRALQNSDLWSLNPNDRSETLAPKLAENWQKQMNKTTRTIYHSDYTPSPEDDTESFELSPTHALMDDNNFEFKASTGTREQPAKQATSKPSLFLAMCQTYALPFLVAGFLKVITDLLNFVGPLILKLLIEYTKDSDEPTWKGYFYAFFLFATAIMQSLVMQHYFHRSFLLGIHLKTAVISLVYNKSLRLSSSARQQSTVGEIVNLMSIDAQRFMDLMTYLHCIWSCPFQIILAVIFLYFTMGPSVFAGVAVMILMIPFNAVIASISRRLQVKQMAQKDRRIRIMNELLNGIKVIKLYAWEDHFEKDVGNIRNKELSILKQTAYLNIGGSFSWTCAPFMVSLATFGIFVLTSDESLTAERAFVALSLFNILRFPMSMLPRLISSIIQASVSLKRLTTFLQNDELDPDNVHNIEETTVGDEDAVVIHNGSFTWDKTESTILENINLNIKPGQLVAVVGHVGAGKSSLISALLGEMEKIEGHVIVKGHVAYVSQQAWIQNATVQDNILFGKPHNAVLYDSVIDCCALGPDLEILPGRDLAEIGEKGINLSGGQKQRVSMARAIYQEADVFYFDDPLSAVDSHVGKHIFDQVIGPQGLLKGKTRVFVTHGLSYLPQCDVIVTIENGRISEMGAYAELIDNNGAFAEFVRAYASMEVEEEEAEAKTCVGSIEDLLEAQASAENLLEGEPSTVDTAKLNIQSDQPKSLEDNQGDVKKTSQLVQEEKAESGNVKLSVMWEYIKSCTLLMGFLTLFFNIGYNGSSVGSSIWLAKWSTDEDNGPGNMTHSTGEYLGIYAVFGAAQAILSICANFCLAMAGIFASRLIHNRLLVNILRLPMSFFDTTPSGRILNRFSKDIYTIDEIIPMALLSFLFTFFAVINTLVVVSYATPLFMVVILPLSVLYLLIQRFYVATSRQLKRLESIRRSPIYTHFQETLLGLSSIRAYRHQERFIMESEHRVDENQAAYYPGICSNRWLAIRLELIGNLIILFATLFAVIERNSSGDGIDPGLAGLSISYALQVTQSLNWIVRMTSELEANIVAVERTKEYAEVTNEAPAIIYDHRPPHNWPSTGRVQFEQYSTRYREGLDLVLKEVTCNIRGGEKVGIVGRTGAGKSSMTLGLFRIIEAAGGSIIIDDHNIATFGLQDLRSRITIIPQDPVLFANTLRSNLDPFDKYTDNEVWKCLESAHLKEYVLSLDDQLSHQIAEGGENLSVGQCQLVCLGRALLRKTKVLVLDEATAAVDMETDDLIQRTIRTEFANCTVITIAHRLNTIMDYDRILVLEAGKVVEFGSPKELLENKEIFYGMVKAAGLV